MHVSWVDICADISGLYWNFEVVVPGLEEECLVFYTDIQLLTHNKKHCQLLTMTIHLKEGKAVLMMITWKRDQYMEQCL